MPVTQTRLSLVKGSAGVIAKRGTSKQAAASEKASIPLVAQPPDLDFASGHARMGFFSFHRYASPLFLALFFTALGHSDPIPVRHPQGSQHGWVSLTTLESKRLAVGDVTQVPRGSDHL